MYAAPLISVPANPAPARSTGVACPLNHGIAALDQLLASLSGDDNAQAFDAALDLRSLLANFTDATAIIHEFYRVRSLVEERHYLTCYRLRRWLESQLIAWVKVQRHHPERSVAVHLEATCFEQLHERCAHEVIEGGSAAAFARVRFALVSNPFSA